MRDIASITQFIEESFPDSLRPPDDDLFEAYEPAIPQFLEMIEGKDWKGFLHVLETAEFSTVQFYGSLIGYMTPETFIYFTPALLIYSMNEDADMVADSFFWQLSPSKNAEEVYSTKLQAVLDTFSDQQKRAVALVVDYYTRQDYVINKDTGMKDYSPMYEDYGPLLNLWMPWL
jgi:hypothetical protein